MGNSLCSIVSFESLSVPIIEYVAEMVGRGCVIYLNSSINHCIRKAVSQPILILTIFYYVGYGYLIYIAIKEIYFTIRNKEG